MEVALSAKNVMFPMKFFVSVNVFGKQALSQFHCRITSLQSTAL